VAIRALLLACSLAALACGLMGWFIPLSHPKAPTVHPPFSQMAAPTNLPKVDSLVRLVIHSAPFRAARRPAAVTFDPAGSRGPAEAASAKPQPTLVLSGVVWGVEPVAVVEGFPGVERPQVMRRGEVIGGVTLQRIRRDQVWLTSEDTSWSLRVRQPWQ
jgi:hypothetical protein